jgi:hypothetical protein
MLTLKVFVNNEQIDEVRIQNMSKIAPDGAHIYHVLNTHGSVEKEFEHHRSLGWKVLVHKVLDYMIKHSRVVNKED